MPRITKKTPAPKTEPKKHTSGPTIPHAERKKRGQKSTSVALTETGRALLKVVALPGESQLRTVERLLVDEAGRMGK